MGPFWAGLAAYHFLPFLRRTTVVPPAKGSNRKAGTLLRRRHPEASTPFLNCHRFAPCFLR